MEKVAQDEGRPQAPHLGSQPNDPWVPVAVPDEDVLRQRYSQLVERDEDTGEVLRIGDYAIHPVARFSRLLSLEELLPRVRDIAELGQQETIKTLADGSTVDGKHRLMICLMLNVGPRFEVSRTPEPILAAASLTTKRQHMDATERAMYAARLSIYSQSLEENGATLRQRFSLQGAADELRVGSRSVDDAAKVVKSKVRLLIEAVDSRSLTVSAAGLLVSKLAGDELAAVVAGGTDSMKFKASELYRASRTKAGENGKKSGSAKQKENSKKSESANRQPGAAVEQKIEATPPVPAANPGSPPNTEAKPPEKGMRQQQGLGGEEDDHKAPEESGDDGEDADAEVNVAPCTSPSPTGATAPPIFDTNTHKEQAGQQNGPPIAQPDLKPSSLPAPMADVDSNLDDLLITVGNTALPNTEPPADHSEPTLPPEPVHAEPLEGQLDLEGQPLNEKPAEVQHAPGQPVLSALSDLSDILDRLELVLSAALEAGISIPGAQSHWAASASRLQKLSELVRKVARPRGVAVIGASRD